MKTLQDKIRERENAISELKSVMLTEVGMKVLMRILDLCAMDAESLVKDNVNLTMYNIGKQAVGRDLVDMFNAAHPDAYHAAVLRKVKEEKYAR